MYFVPKDNNSLCTSTTGCNREDSSEMCKQNGGQLATILDAKENKMVKYLKWRVPNPPGKIFRFWIGLNDVVSI